MLVNKSEITIALETYIVQEILDEKDIGLDEKTPLLEWGIINSIELTRLLGFIERQFHVHVSPHEVNPDHFTDIASITQLILAHDKPVSANTKNINH